MEVILNFIVVVNIYNVTLIVGFYFDVVKNFNDVNVIPDGGNENLNLKLWIHTDNYDFDDNIDTVNN